MCNLLLLSLIRINIYNNIYKTIWCISSLIGLCFNINDMQLYTQHKCYGNHLISRMQTDHNANTIHCVIYDTSYGVSWHVWLANRVTRHPRRVAIDKTGCVARHQFAIKGVQFTTPTPMSPDTNWLRQTQWLVSTDTNWCQVTPNWVDRLQTCVIWHQTWVQVAGLR